MQGVLDFGVARVGSSPAPASDPLTQGDKPLGTLAYMAPEQIRDPSAVDARADVYSACAILLEALSGQQRFEAEGARERIFRVLNEAAPRLDAQSRAPRALADVVARGLSREPEARQRDAAELAAALREFAGIDVAQPSSAQKKSGFGAGQLLLLGFGMTMGGAAVQLGHSASAQHAPLEAVNAGAPGLSRAPRALVTSSEPPLPTPLPSEPLVGDAGAVSSVPRPSSLPARVRHQGPPASDSAVPVPAAVKPAIGLERANPYE